MKGDTIARVRRQQALRRGRVNWPRPPPYDALRSDSGKSFMDAQEVEWAVEWATATRIPGTLAAPLPMPWLG